MKQSQRTKNRLREHCLVAEEEAWFVGDGELHNRLCVFFHCADKNCDWTGWLPKDEL